MEKFMKKDEFIQYLGAENSLYGYQKSYKLVLLQAFFSHIKSDGTAELKPVIEAFKQFYFYRQQKGLPVEFNADQRIMNIKDSSVDDVFQVVKSQPFKVLREKGILKILKPLDADYHFVMDAEIIKDLTTEDLSKINNILDKKILFYFGEAKNITGGLESSDLTIRLDCGSHPAQRIARRTITPEEKLKIRIAKEFNKKKFIGDIQISDTEYTMLLAYLNKAYKKIHDSNSHSVIDPVFATALVHAGIRCYKGGNFWSNIAREAELGGLHPYQQLWLRESFVATLEKYNKLRIEDDETINNILMHGFVCDSNANGFFDFLFAYYRIDLERDITRNDKDAMDSLMETMQREDNTGRSYLLAKQTADAVRANPRGCRTRIRRFIKQIDEIFWDNKLSGKGKNRLKLLLNEWKEDSVDLKSDHQRLLSSGNHDRKKLLSSPYIKAAFTRSCFQIILPPQLLKTSLGQQDVAWLIKIHDIDIAEIEKETHEAITGCKIYESTYDLDSSMLFEKIDIHLMCGESRVKPSPFLKKISGFLM
jgi:hypothetical protein